MAVRGLWEKADYQGTLSRSGRLPAAMSLTLPERRDSSLTVRRTPGGVPSGPRDALAPLSSPIIKSLASTGSRPRSRRCLTTFWREIQFPIVDDHSLTVVARSWLNKKSRGISEVLQSRARQQAVFGNRR